MRLLAHHLLLETAFLDPPVKCDARAKLLVGAELYDCSLWTPPALVCAWCGCARVGGAGGRGGRVRNRTDFVRAPMQVFVSGPSAHVCDFPCMATVP